MMMVFAAESPKETSMIREAAAELCSNCGMKSFGTARFSA